MRLRVSTTERQAWEVEAAKDKMSLSSWVRMCCNMLANVRNGDGVVVATAEVAESSSTGRAHGLGP